VGAFAELGLSVRLRLRTLAVRSANCNLVAEAAIDVVLTLGDDPDPSLTLFAEAVSRGPTVPGQPGLAERGRRCRIAA
jgi:hypothetical protein